jgi:hypothetical protein
LPLSDDFTRAQVLLNKFDKILRDTNRATSLRQIFYEDVLLQIQSIWDTRLINALPQSYEDALVALKEDIGMTHQPNATRSLEWLEQNGKCVDHITWDMSTQEGAGHGGFAKRDLADGTIITGSPLHHIPFKETFMDIYDIVENHRGQLVKGTKVLGQQILLNYCFGHPETSLLLCPYGAGVNYINHNKTLANVKVVWAEKGSTGQDVTWFNKSLTEFLEDPRAHLALDYVATRPIKKGEELFLDYGDEWEKAWQQHVDSWQPEHSWASAYLNAKDWNDKFVDFPLRTEEESVWDPYPTTLQLRCHTELVDLSNWQKKVDWTWDLSEYGYGCEIFERYLDEFGDYVYSIELTTEPKDRWDFDDDERTLEFEGVPRGAISFVDLPGTTDIHLRKAFRHAIGLPEELMQDAWRNIPKEKTPKFSTSSRSGSIVHPTESTTHKEYRKPSRLQVPKEPGLPEYHDGNEL